MEYKMKDSGIPWIGEIPEHWVVLPLRALFIENNEKSNEGNFILLSLSQYIGILPKNETRISDSHIAQSYDGYKIVKSGQFVMNIMLAWNGSYALSYYDGIISPAYCIYDFKIDCNKKYYHYLLKTPGYPEAFKTSSRGIIDSRLRLYPEQFYKFDTIFPPISIQDEIVMYLDTKCDEIDKLILLQEKMIADLQAYKQAVITESVTKGLDKNVKMKDSGIEWIGEIPEHWDICKLKNTARLYSGNSIKDELKDNFTDKTDARPYISSKDIDKIFCKANYTNGMYVKINDINFRVAPKNSVLMCIEGGSAGKKKVYLDEEVAFVNKLCCFNPYIAMTGKFIFYYICTGMFEDVFFSKITGMIGGVSLPILANINCVLPPLNEQQQIAEYLDKKCDDIDKLILLKKQKIEELKEYKKSVIFEYVTGKKQVKNLSGRR